MKNIVNFFAAFVISAGAYSQVPKSFNYQAVVRNNSGAVIANTPVSIRISILKGSPTGTAECVEIFSPTTNDYGLVSLAIGSVNTSDFSAITWHSDDYYIKIEMDINGGTTYQIMGTTQLISVPYALHSATSNNCDLLDSHDGSYFLSASSLNAGTLSTDRYNAYDDMQQAGYLDNNNTFDLLTRTQADARYNNLTAFFAYNSTDDNRSTVNPSIVEFNSQKYDFENAYDNTNDKFVATVDGVYSVSAGVLFDNLASETSIYIYIYVNNVAINILASLGNASGSATLNGSTSLYLNSGDEVSVYSISSDASYTIRGNADFAQTWFSGTLLKADY